MGCSYPCTRTSTRASSSQCEEAFSTTSERRSSSSTACESGESRARGAHSEEHSGSSGGNQGVVYLGAPARRQRETGKGVSFYAARVNTIQVPSEFVPAKSKTYVPKPPCANKKNQPRAETVDWHLQSLARPQEMITEDMQDLNPGDPGYNELYQRETQLKYL